MKTFRERGDESGANVIGSSCIACLTHLAVLYEAVSRMGPVAGCACDLCDSALRRLGSLTSDLHFEEYTYLDILLGVRPFPYQFLRVTIQTGTGIGLLEKITCDLRHSHRVSPVRREQVAAVFPGDRQGNIFQFSGRIP